MTETECAYAAGLLDGEGNILIGVNKRKGREYHYLQVRISNTDLRMLLWLRERWGGSIHPSVRHHGWKPGNNWYLSNGVAIGFLRDVVPYVVIKAEQIEVAIDFRATMTCNPRRAMVAVGVLQERERLRWKLRAFTKRGLMEVS